VENDLEIKSLCLVVISKCVLVKHGWTFAIGAGIVPTLTRVLTGLQSPPSNLSPTDLKHAAAVESHTCKCLAYCGVANAGKDECVRCGAIPLLVKLLNHSDGEVRSNASLALMNVTIAQSGKVAAIEADAVNALINRISQENELDVVKVNSMQALANVSEHPNSKKSGRMKSDTTINTFKDLIDHSTNPLVKSSATSALDKILWMP